jgi:putative ABC transport system permease protein
MNMLSIIQLAFEALKERKVRSILTILMVTTGSALLIAVNGLTTGFLAFADRQFSQLAPNVIFVTPAPTQSSGFADAPNSPKIVLTQVVADRIKNLPGVSDVIPNYIGTVTIESRGKTFNARVFAQDPTKIYSIAPAIKFDEGSIIDKNPSSLIISERIARPPGESVPFATLGQTVVVKYSYVDEDGKQQVNSRTFVVKAIMKITGNPTIDGAIIMNQDIANSLMKKKNRYDSIVVIARNADLVESVEEGIRKLYGNDIGITSAKVILKTIREFIGGITTFLFSIAVISLVVGSIGIITTLYTSVVERTREIGIFKAIGAKKNTILLLFLMEALIIGSIGATIGIPLGIAGGNILSNFAPGNRDAPPDARATPLYTIEDISRVVSLSIALSVVSGLYPAVRASRLEPVVALGRL